MSKSKPYYVLAAAIVIGALILAAAWLQHSAANRYSLMVGKDGVVTRIDRKTGEFAELDGGKALSMEDGERFPKAGEGEGEMFGLPEGFSYTEPLDAESDASGWIVAQNDSAEWVEEIEFVFRSKLIDEVWISKIYTINASLPPNAKADYNFLYSFEDLKMIQSLGQGNLSCEILKRELDEEEIDSEVLVFEESGGALIASRIRLRLKPLSDTEIGVIVDLDPAHHIPPTKDDSYTFTVKLADADGFNLSEIVVHEWEMTALVRDNGLVSRRQFETSILMLPEQYARISDVSISYRSSSARKTLYEQRRAAGERLWAATERGQTKREEQEGRADEARQERLAAWAQIKQGVKRQRVEELLGQPERMLSLSTFTRLYYEGGSSVQFSRSGVVDSYSKPR